jgi:hypothetical protein
MSYFIQALGLNINQCSLVREFIIALNLSDEEEDIKKVNETAP